MSAKLYRIWSWDGNDRSEVARVKADDFDKVSEFLLAEFIKPEYRDDIETDEGGLQWSSNTPEECVKMLITDGIECTDCASSDIQVGESPDELRCKRCGAAWGPCEGCEGCLVGLHIEEVETPDPDYGETWDFKTIYGTNDFYDLTGEEPIKAEDWHPRLAAVWKKTPELAGDALIAATIKPEHEKSVSPALLERGRKALEEAED